MASFPSSALQLIFNIAHVRLTQACISDQGLSHRLPAEIKRQANMRSARSLHRDIAALVGWKSAHSALADLTDAFHW